VSPPLRILSTLQTESLDQGDQDLHTTTELISTAIATDPAIQGLKVAQASTSGTETGPSLPPPPQTNTISTSPDWSGVESDKGTSSNMVETSKVVSTSPSDPPPQQD
jgi:hypothetical protein